MKAKIQFLLVFSLIFISVNSQVPQGFNYQAIARDGSGNPIPSTSLPTRLTVQADSLGTSIIWQEVHSSVMSNSFGMINLVMGKGARQASSTVGAFSDIDWSVTPKFIKTEIFYGGTYKTLGVSRLWSVPYSIAAASIEGSLDKLAVKGTTANLEEPLFEVRNKDGQIIFAVYNEGVRIYVSDGLKGSKGGFAVGGFDQTKTWNQDFLRVTPDSVRIYIDDKAKGSKGGFAVGGFDNTKGGNINFFNVATANDGIINPSQNRVLWYPLKNAFLSGKVLIASPADVGENSFATGYESKAKGMYSQAMGYKSVANGDYSTAIGKNATANDVNSFAFGENSNAKASQTYALGNNASALAVGSYALGYNAKASGQDAFAIGTGTEASGQGSFAIGFIGRDSGNLVTSNTLAGSPWSVAIGMGAQAKAQGAFALGTQVQATGAYSLALGYLTSATGYYSTAMGYKTTAGFSGTAMGTQTSANGMHSTAIGYRTVTYGVSSLATGTSTKANQPYSASFGKSTLADGSGAVAMGIFTKAKSTSMLVLGRYNDTTVTQLDSYRTWYSTDPVFVCGNGSADNLRSNAFTVLKNGYTAIGHASPTQMLDVNGNARFRSIGSGAYVGPVNRTSDGTLTTATSDIRTKNDINTITNSLDAVLNLRGVTFTWKSDPQMGRRIGFVAQEVEKVLPELVFTNPEDGLKGVNYAEMSAVLVEAIKEQERMIISQQQQIDALKALVDKLISQDK